LVPLFRGGGLAAAAVALGMSSPCHGVLVPIRGASLLSCLATPNGGDTGIKLEPLHPDFLETITLLWRTGQCDTSHLRLR